MKSKDLDRLLEQHPFFQDMDDKLRQIIVGCATNARFAAGEYLFKEGGPADQFYLIRHGAVALEIHLPGRQPLVVDTLHEGEIIGWSWLLPPYRWLLDARAMQLTRALRLEARCLREKMDNDHELAYELYRRFLPVISERLQAGRLRLIDMYGVSEDGI